MEHHSETTFFPLLLVSILAFLIPIITAWINNNVRLAIPAVVGEIICGIIIGKSVLGLIPATNAFAWLEFLSLFGFTYLMFLSGLEIDFSLLASENSIKRVVPEKKKIINQPLKIGFIYFGLTLLASIIVSLILYFMGYIKSWPFIALILSTVSVGIVVPILKEKEVLKSFLGQTILICALVADFVCMILITVMVAFYTEGIFSTTFMTVLLIGLFAFIIYKFFLAKIFGFLIEFLEYFQSLLNKLTHATTQIKVRGSIALMVVFIFMAQIVGIEIILGAFIAGILTTLLLGESKTAELEMKLDAIGYGFFIPIFFISVGIDLDLKAFLASDDIYVILAVLIITAFVVKILPSLILSYNFNIRNSIASGILLSSNLSLPIAAATIGLKEGLITEAMNTSIVIMAVSTCILSPIIFNKMFKCEAQDTKIKVAILGVNDIAIKLADKLIELHQNVILIALTPNEFAIMKNHNLPGVNIISDQAQALVNVDMSTVKTLITTTNDDNFNLSMCLIAKEEYNISNLMSVVNDYAQVEIFKKQKIDPINNIDSMADNFVNKIVSPEGYAILAREDEEIMIADMWVTNTAYNGRAIKDITLPGNTLIVQIKRDSEHIIPHGNTIISLNDSFTLVGSPESVNKTINLIGTTPNQYCPMPEISMEKA